MGSGPAVQLPRGQGVGPVDSIPKRCTGICQQEGREGRQSDDRCDKRDGSVNRRDGSVSRRDGSADPPPACFTRHNWIPRSRWIVGTGPLHAAARGPWGAEIGGFPSLSVRDALTWEAGHLRGKGGEQRIGWQRGYMAYTDETAAGEAESLRVKSWAHAWGVMGGEEGTGMYGRGQDWIV